MIISCMIKLEVQCMNHNKSRLNMFCNARQLITLYFVLLEYCSRGLKTGKIELKLALTVFDKSRNTGKRMFRGVRGGGVVVAFKVSLFSGFPGQFGS